MPTEETNKTVRFTIRDVPQEVVDKLDSIVKDEGYASRNQLVIEILTNYTNCKSGLFYQILPPIIKEICSQSVSDYGKDLTAVSEISAKNISLAAVQLLKITQWFEEYIIADSSLKAQEELTELINSIKKE